MDIFPMPTTQEQLLPHGWEEQVLLSDKLQEKCAFVGFPVP